MPVNHNCCCRDAQALQEKLAKKAQSESKAKDNAK